ncbi:MAG TPA: hypothetical protein VJS11_02065 [Acidobacteriaceae bacterium]|nr:hypothetical protein [Acidobacteriaceae bacterium]
MSSGWKIAPPALLLVLMAGCNYLPHRGPQPVPEAATAPSRPVSEMAQLMPPMPNLPPVTDERQIRLDASIPPTAPPPAPEERPKHVRRHTRAVTTEPAQEATKSTPPASATPSTDVASNAQPSDVSPLGQIAPNSNANTADRQQLTDQINATEKSLTDLHRSLNSEEHKTAELIRVYITKARQALKTDDLDGARNYSTKAKILLDELTKP